MMHDHDDSEAHGGQWSTTGQPSEDHQADDQRLSLGRRLPFSATPALPVVIQ
jgi:hypothetical protein